MLCPSLRGRKLTALLFFKHKHSSALIYCVISDLVELGLEQLPELKFSLHPRADRCVPGGKEMLVAPGSCDLIVMVHGKGWLFLPQRPRHELR